mmetsp:Transcript_33362/g.79227  ORF Transcript_33362/g.79227 Transcript_33362/m.79227 type:complete len:200 (-) Transcript_33362:292-891(-)
MPASSSCARDLRGMPSLNVITSSFSVTRLGMGDGTSATTRERCRLSPTSTRLEASILKSSSFSCSRLASVSSDVKSNSGSKKASSLPSTRDCTMSCRITRATSTCCSLTTTLAPPRSRAAWTCAIDAVESGVGSKDSMALARSPSSLARVRIVCESGRGGLASSMRLRCRTIGGATRSEREAMYCPIFTQRPPSPSRLP